jgi:hypothetical protein
LEFFPVQWQKTINKLPQHVWTGEISNKKYYAPDVTEIGPVRKLKDHTGTMKIVCKFKKLLSFILFFKTTPTYIHVRKRQSSIAYISGSRGIPYVKTVQRMGYIL